MSKNANNGNITVIDPQGHPVECEILFTFDSQDFGKSYVVYTDHTTDRDGVQKVYAAIYDPEGKDLTLQEIRTKAEWKMIDKLLEDYDNDLLDI